MLVIIVVIVHRQRVNSELLQGTRLRESIEEVGEAAMRVERGERRASTPHEQGLFVGIVAQYSST